jgi:hypothetical protein
MGTDGLESRATPAPRFFKVPVLHKRVSTFPTIYIHLSIFTAAMILDQIAWSDCIVFLVFLAPQLIIHVGLIKTAICAIKALPFLSTLLCTRLMQSPCS